MVRSVFVSQGRRNSLLAVGAGLLQPWTPELWRELGTNSVYIYIHCAGNWEGAVAADVADATDKCGNEGSLNEKNAGRRFTRRIRAIQNVFFYNISKVTFQLVESPIKPA